MLPRPGVEVVEGTQSATTVEFILERAELAVNRA
jgi:hypothetical protein